MPRISLGLAAGPAQPGEDSPGHTFSLKLPPLSDQVEVFITVDEVLALGTSASSRISITATATTDASSAMNTLVRSQIYIETSLFPGEQNSYTIPHFGKL